MSRQWLLLVSCMALLCGGLAEVFPVCNDVELDVMLIMDTSRSISDKSLASVTAGTHTLISSLNLDKTRVGVVSYNHDAEVMHSLHEFNKEAISKLNLDKRGPFATLDAGTNTAGGMKLGMEHFEKHARTGVKQIMVVVTDGRATVNIEEICNKIHLSTDILVIAVGIGPKCDIVELEQIASGVNDLNVFLAHNFQKFVDITSHVAAKICLISEQFKPNTVTCDIPCLKNGQVFPSQRMLGDINEFKCDPSFSLKGAKSITCLSTGWSAEPPTCTSVKRCPYKVGISRGKVIKSENHNHEGGQVHYKCDRNYVLVPSEAKATCVDGEWNRNQPDCVYKKCKSISGIANGIIEKMNTEPNRGVVRFKCDLGYALDGPIQLECGMDREWTYLNQPHSPPSCNKQSCEPQISSFRNGQVTLENNVYLFRCHDRYQLTGPRKRFCDHTTHTWSPPDMPECVYVGCKAIPLIRYGNVMHSADKNTMMFSCKVGYRLNQGDGVFKCTDGEWKDKDDNMVLPKCEENQCSIISQYKNGYITGYNTVIGSKLKFHCNKGYALSEDGDFECMLNKKWSRSLPKCRSIRNAEKDVMCPQIVDLNGHGRCTGSLAVGGTVSCVCDQGFELVGTKTPTCNANGRWNEVPKCEWHSCGIIGGLRGGRISGSGMFVGAKLKAECHNGFKLTGPEAIECQEDLTWSGELRCSYSRCPNIPAVHKVRHANVTDDGDVEGSKATFSCDDGYVLAGAKTVTCVNNEWSPNLPKCERNTCKPLQFIDHGKVIGVDYTVGASVKIECNEGYRAFPPGAETVTCEADRSWSKDVRCKHYKCKTVSSFRNGKVTRYGDQVGDAPKFICDPGYTINGGASTSLTLRCEDDAVLGPQWSDDIPECERATLCPSLCPKKGHPYARYASKAVGAESFFACPVGEMLHGNAKAKCESSGAWSTDPATATCESALISECEDVHQDVVILVDESQSIGAREYRQMINLLVKLVTLYDVAAEKTRIGLAMFAKDARIIFGPGKHTSIDPLMEAIVSTERAPEASRRETRTHTGLKLVRKSLDIFYPDQISKIMILFTDGKSKNSKKAIKQADRLKKKGIELFCVGIGKDYNVNELNSIATAPNGSYVYQLRNIEEEKTFTNTLRKLVGQTCTVTKSSPTYGAVLDPSLVFKAEECRDIRMDVFYVVDTSKSISPSEFVVVLQLLDALSRNFDKSVTREGTIMFNNDAKVTSELGDNDFSKLVPATKGGTNTPAGLELMLEKHAQDTETGAEKICILITDGKATKDMASIKQKLKARKADKTLKCFVMTIGENFAKADEEDLNEIDYTGNILQFTKFSDVSTNKLIGFAKSICSA